MKERDVRFYSLLILSLVCFGVAGILVGHLTGENLYALAVTFGGCGLLTSALATVTFMESWLIRYWSGETED